MKPMRLEGQQLEHIIAFDLRFDFYLDKPQLAASACQSGAGGLLHDR
jgi:hypothetical protein